LDSARTLKVYCQVFPVSATWKHGDVRKPRNESGLELLIQDFRTLMHDSQLSNVTIITETESITSFKGILSGMKKFLRILFPKIVIKKRSRGFHNVFEDAKRGSFELIYLFVINLSARSPVFKAIFGAGMLESTKNEIRIQDFSAKTVKGMLQYIYTGQTESIEENAGELVKIADKYQVLGLKADCEVILGTDLTVQNAAEILILAHLSNALRLKAQALSFINRYAKIFHSMFFKSCSGFVCKI
jgi:BTB/POZ domain